MAIKISKIEKIYQKKNSYFIIKINLENLEKVINIEGVIYKDVSIYISLSKLFNCLSCILCEQSNSQLVGQVKHLFVYFMQLHQLRLK